MIVQLCCVLFQLTLLFWLTADTAQGDGHYWDFYLWWTSVITADVFDSYLKGKHQLSFPKQHPDPSFPLSTYPLLPACSPLPGLLCLPALLLSLLHGLSLHPHLSPPPLLSLHLLDVWPVVPGLAHRVEDLLHQQQAVRFVAAGDLWQGGRIGLGCWMLNTQVNSWNLPTHKM